MNPPSPFVLFDRSLIWQDYDWLHSRSVDNKLAHDVSLATYRTFDRMIGINITFIEADFYD